MLDLKNKLDGDLLHLYKEKGDIAIVAELFDRYRLLVHGTCLKYLQNQDLAEDASQEIFIQLTKKLSSHEVLEFRPWIYVVTKNFCFDLLRKNKRQIPKQNEAEFMYSGEIFHPNDVVDETTLSKLNQCLESLPQEQKSCIKLFYFDELSYNQIEFDTGFSWNNIRSFIQNGRRNLKNCMEKIK